MNFSKLMILLGALLLLAVLSVPQATADNSTYMGNSYNGGGPVEPDAVHVPNAQPPPPLPPPPTTDNGGTRTRTKRSIRSRSVRTTPPPPGG